MVTGGADYKEILETLFSSAAAMTIILIVGSIIIGTLLIIYVLESIGLYRMAKKLNHDKAWLAWIPYAKLWLLFDMPKKEFRVLALNKEIPVRTNAFWIYIAITYGSGIVLNMLAVIPIINWVVAFISPLMGIALTLVFVFMMYPAYKDLFDLFLPEPTSKGYTLASIICSCLGLGIVAPILLLIASSKEPVEVIENQEYTSDYTY